MVWLWGLGVEKCLFNKQISIDTSTEYTEPVWATSLGGDVRLAYLSYQS